MKKIAFLKSISLILTATLFLSSAPASTAKAQETDHIEDLLTSMTLPEKVGQMIIADFRTWNEHPEDANSVNEPVTILRDEIREAVERNRFGGVILFAENCADNSELAALVNDLQLANQAGAAGTPIGLLIAIDQEGGSVARLAQDCRWIGNMALTATGDPANAYTVGSAIGEDLSLLGINTDFAPVVDVNDNPANPVIGVRSFSDDPAIVSEYACAFLGGLQSQNIIASLKHFPGHGNTATDSHTGLPMVNKNYEELQATELIPFKNAIDAGAEMIMTAHIQYPEIEPTTYVSISTGEDVYLPATLSHTILTDILRDDLGFEGVVVSDALNMDAIKSHFDMHDVYRLLIEAGVDLFLMPVPVTDAQSLSRLEEMISYIVSLVEEGTIPEERIDESLRRILTLKEKHGLLVAAFEALTKESIQKALDGVGTTEDHALEWEMMQKAVTLLKAQDGCFPITCQDGERILFLFSGASRQLSGTFAVNRLVEEGLLPQNVSYQLLNCDENPPQECVSAAREADHVILVSALFSADEFYPGDDNELYTGIFDQVINALHEQGKTAFLISAFLPYDVARFQEADVILVTYGSTAMRSLPEGKSSYSVNIPAAICSLFGEFEPQGKLPVDIPALDGSWAFTDQVLYAKD